MHQHHKIYHGWDTHSYTRDFNQVLGSTEGQCLTRRMSDRIEWEDWRRLSQEIRSFYSPTVAGAAMTNMEGIYQAKTGGFYDMQLQTGFNGASLLSVLWSDIKQQNDPSVFQGFGEILQDIGGTCMQGVSHRLLSYYIALQRDHRDQTENPQNHNTSTPSPTATGEGSNLQGASHVLTLWNQMDTKHSIS